MHYEFTGNTKLAHGTTLKQIRALVDLPQHNVSRGQVGGWIEHEHNLRGSAWVGGNAHVLGDARVLGNAHVYGYARVLGDAQVYGDELGEEVVKELYISPRKSSYKDFSKKHLTD